MKISVVVYIIKHKCVHRNPIWNGSFTFFYFCVILKFRSFIKFFSCSLLKFDSKNFWYENVIKTFARRLIEYLCNFRVFGLHNIFAPKKKKTEERTKREVVILCVYENTFLFLDTKISKCRVYFCNITPSLRMTLD